MNQFVPMRYGIPSEIHFQSDQAMWDYARDCQRIRNELPAGEARVAPRVSLSTWRGRPLESGTTVALSDFGEGETGRQRFESLIFRGYILRSEQPTTEELAEIAAHVQRVREMNSAFIAEGVGAKLDRLLGERGE